MTDDQRVNAVAELGFTPRQATFLVTVALHSGVCLARQYATFAGLTWGQVVRDFFAVLVKRRLATPCPCTRQGAHLYHLRNKALYRAIGEADSRLRRPISLARAVERLMLLDAVLADPQLVWLASERDKLAHFEARTTLRPDEMPRLIFRGASGTSSRYFPERLPIGCHPDGRAPVFVYLVRQWDPFEFRGFLQRHGALLCALADWQIRLVVPPHLEGVEQRYSIAVWNELGTPLKPDAVTELKWYFERRRQLADNEVETSEERYRLAHARFSGPRFRALYREWKQAGNELLEFQSSPLLSEALERKRGRVDCHVLQRQYAHLSPLVGTV